MNYSFILSVPFSTARSHIIYLRHAQLGFSTVPPDTINAFNNSYVLLDWKIASSDLENLQFANLKWKYSNNERIASLQLEPDGDVVVDVPKFAGRIFFNVINGSKFNINSSVITFGPLNLSDEGQIICEVTLNSKNPYTDSTNLVILVEPRFNDINQKTTAIVNELAYISCTITSKPQANVTWFVNDTLINSTDRYITKATTKNSLNTEYTLYIKNASVFDAGLYMCSASIGYTKSNQSFELIINYPAYITYLPQQFQAATDETVELVCEARGSPTPVMSWYKNNSLLISNDLYEITQSIQYNKYDSVAEVILYINPVKISDFDTYTCQVQNNFSGFVNGSTQLVARRNLSFLTQPSEVKVYLGDSITINCTAQAYPKLTVNWVILNNNRTTISSPKVLVETQDNVIVEILLTINNSTLDDYGNYTCVANNSDGNITTNTTLNVIWNLSFLTQPSSEENVYLGGSITLNCTVQGYPKPWVNWLTLNNNRTTISSTKVLVETQDNIIVEILLTINNITFDDNGTYTCVASISNVIKTTITTLNVISIKPPVPFSPASFQAPSSWHKEWYIVIWVFIPIVCVLFFILAVLLARRRRNNKAVVVVPVNRSVPDPPVRSMATQRDIYLPEANQLPAVNFGYTPDVDVQEIEVEFNEDSSVYLESVEYNPDAGNAFYNHYDQAGPAPKNKNEVQGELNAGYAVIDDKVKLFDHKKKFNLI
ncbi:matrix-remodeling-associated protein 5 isoform X2 [Hydra vulgaris]|uniref:matrix-remodeling-associated protein 5 isoform X2 n=1 Tax=Hydra vulgaris TaxID=6087 RepID=UPI001F5F638B|nr:matrix-remodeling-associated protein 5 isoform X2 [Hydra vulgaris]